MGKAGFCGRKPSFEFNAALTASLKEQMERENNTLTEVLRSRKIDLRTFNKHCPEDIYYELFRFGRKARFGPNIREIVPRHQQERAKKKTSEPLVAVKVESAEYVPLKKYTPRDHRPSDGRPERNALLTQTTKALFSTDGAVLRPQVVEAIGRIVKSMTSMDRFNEVIDDELIALEDTGVILREQRGALRATLTVLFINLYTIP